MKALIDNANIVQTLFYEDSAVPDGLTTVNVRGFTNDVSDEFGKLPIMKYDINTEMITYEYVERRLTPEEEILKIKEQMTAQQAAINNILGV